MLPMQKLGVFLVITLFAGILTGCSQGPGNTAAGQGQVVTAKVTTLKLSPLTIHAVVPGTVISAERIEVSSRLTGYVHELNVHEGETVTKDQLLLKVDPAGVKARIRQAQGELAKAKAALADARANYKRYQDLYRHQATTGQRYQAIQTRYQVAMGSYRAAEAALASVRTQLKYAEVHAPFTGLIVSKLVDNGQLATPGTPLLILEDPNHLQVRMQVNEQVFAHLKLGQQIPVRFTGPGFKTHTVTGSIERLVAAANPVTHTHLVKIGLPAKSGVSSGEYGLVSIPVGTQQGIVVPKQAIHDRAGLMGAFVVDAKGRAQFRMVTLGGQLPHGQVVLSGLFAGDRLIVSAQQPLINGMRIRAQAGGGA